MLLSLCEEIMEKTGNMSGLSKEGGAHNQNNPGIGSEKWSKSGKYQQHC